MSKRAQRGLRNVLLPHTALSHTVHPQPCTTHNESSAHSCSRDSPNLGFDLICHCHTINSNQIRAHLFLIWIFANAGYRYHKRAVQKTRRSSLIWVKSLCQSSVVVDAHTADPPRTANQLKALLWCPRPDTIPAEGKKPPWQDTRNSIKTSFRMSKKVKNHLTSEIWGSSLPVLLQTQPICDGQRTIRATALPSGARTESLLLPGLSQRWAEWELST